MVALVRSGQLMSVYPNNGIGVRLTVILTMLAAMTVHSRRFFHHRSQSRTTGAVIGQQKCNRESDLTDLVNPVTGVGNGVMDGVAERRTGPQVQVLIGDTEGLEASKTPVRCLRRVGLVGDIALMTI